MAPREVNYEDEFAVWQRIGGVWVNREIEDGGKDAFLPWDIVTERNIKVDVKGLDQEGGRLGIKYQQLFNTSGADAFVLRDRFNGYMGWASRAHLIWLHEHGFSTVRLIKEKKVVYFQRMDLNPDVMLLA